MKPALCLARPPIREAILDLRILPPLPDHRVFRDVQAQLGDAYPEKLERVRWSQSLQLSPQAASSTTEVDSKPFGFAFRTADGKRTAQFRIDGFTFNQLHPYTTWEDMRDEAHRLWALYVQAAEPASVQRAALRYINVLEIEAQEATPQRWLKSAAALARPEGSLRSFMNRTWTSLPGARELVLTEAVEAGGPDQPARVVIDVDVFALREFPRHGDELWNEMEALRDTKDEVFFGTVTEELLQRCR